jgi:hypothetical protein
MNHVDNQYDPEQDDVVGVEELDIDLEAETDEAWAELDDE